MTASPPPSPRSHRLLLWAALCLAALGTAAAPAAADTDLPLLVGFQSIWNITGPAREQRYRVEIEAVVNYYDPVWRQLWCQDKSGTMFLQPPVEHLPIRSGQLVHFTGIMKPAAAGQIESLTATTLREDGGIVAVPTAGRLTDRDAFNERLVAIEGYVDTQTLNDPNHLRLWIVAEGHRIPVILWLEAGSQVPLLEGALVRAQGVYIGRLDPNNQLQEINLLVPSARQLAITGWLKSDTRFARPATVIERWPDLAPTALVRVCGQITALAAGRSLTIRDGTGQLDLLTPQESNLRLNDKVEAIGYPAINNGKWQLRLALARPQSSAEPGGLRTAVADPLLLRLAEQVLALPADKAAARQQVQLYGVVTWSAPGARFIYLQDPSGGVRVDWTDPGITPPPIGSGVTVHGVSAKGDFAPSVIATRVYWGHGMSPPEPLRISLEQAETGVEEARWVELFGLLREVRPAGAYRQLLLTTATGDFVALAPDDERFAKILGSFVRVRGVCTAVANELRQLTAVQLWVPTVDDVQIEEAPPADLFSLPDNPVASLRQFGPLQSLSHWLRTSGVVTCSVPGRYLLILDGTEGLTVYPTTDTPMVPGDRVEVVGVPGRDGSRIVLRNALVRRVGRMDSLEPTALAPPFPLLDTLDNRLVRLSGQLAEVSALGAERFLTIRHPDGSIIARIPASPAAPAPAAWRKGAEISLTGVYRLIFDEHRQRTGFELLLRDERDLVVLRQPSWWTAERALAAAGALALLAGAIALWVVALRRKVWQQTAQLRAQLDKEAHLEAELERAQRLHSLGTLAGGIAHDFNNLLTVIMGNLTLAMLDHRVMALAGDCLNEAEAGTVRARDLTQQLLTFARGGDPIRESFPLPPLLHETAALALSGAKVRTEVRCPPALWPVHADRAQINRALHNLLAHANEAMPAGGTIDIELANEEIAAGNPHTLDAGRYVRITLTDHGPGLPAEVLPTIFDPYAAAKIGPNRFGLATAYSIARKHHGLLSVRSAEGKGCVFTLWLPAAEARPAPTAPASSGNPVAGARVLFMDDEEAIRRLGEMLLHHLGCEAVLAADGAECVEAYRAARTAGRPFDLVIMDLTVPGGMGGKEAIGELRTIDPAVRAIVSSGYANDEILSHHRDYGFCAVVSKPYEVERLAAAIAAALAEGHPSAGAV